MKISRVLLVLCAVVLMTPAVWAQCTMNVHVASEPGSGEHYQLSWDPVPGATNYTVIEYVFDDDPFFPGGVEKPIGNHTFIELRHYATENVTYEYLVRAYGANELTPLCSGQATTEIQADTNLLLSLNRGIIPIVGSAPGAFGAQFKTYLRLSTQTSATGKLVFHPLGQAARDDDPSLRYELSQTTRSIEWNDVVAAIGASGIGSLDIVPDVDSSLPHVETRVYNDSPNGRFGSSESVYLPADVFANTISVQSAAYADATMRMNVGARTLEPGTHLTVSVITPEGKTRGGLAHTFQYRDPGTYMSPLASFNLTVLPGDTVKLIWDHPVISFYTLTDNQTNDPFIYVAGRATSGDATPASFVK